MIHIIALGPNAVDDLEMDIPEGIAPSEVLVEILAGSRASADLPPGLSYNVALCEFHRDGSDYAGTLFKGYRVKFSHPAIGEYEDDLDFICGSLPEG